VRLQTVFGCLTYSQLMISSTHHTRTKKVGLTVSYTTLPHTILHKHTRPVDTNGFHSIPNKIGFDMKGLAGGRRQEEPERPQECKRLCIRTTLNALNLVIGGLRTRLNSKPPLPGGANGPQNQLHNCTSQPNYPPH
jgi:hypothetical protein